jgi:hypothetical protein
MWVNLIVFFLFGVVLCSGSGSNPPSQIHIALAGVDEDGNSNTMSVSWFTQQNPKSPSVKYGKISSDYSDVAFGTSVIYYETYTSHVVLNNLEPATIYYYIVGDDADGWSMEHTFTSAPLSSHSRGNFSFAVFADLGVVNGGPTIDYVNSIKDSIDFVWHGGDVSYADDAFLHAGCVAKFCYEDTINAYLSNVETWASRIPYMVMPGNHEAGTFYYHFG